MAETIRAYEMGPDTYVGYWITRETEIRILIAGDNYHITTDNKEVNITGTKKDFDTFQAKNNVDVKFIEAK